MTEKKKDTCQYPIVFFIGGIIGAILMFLIGMSMLQSQPTPATFSLYVNDKWIGQTSFEGTAYEFCEALGGSAECQTCGCEITGCRIKYEQPLQPQDSYTLEIPKSCISGSYFCYGDGCDYNCNIEEVEVQQ